MRLFLLFYLISIFAFSQTDKQTIFLQATYGNAFYNRPSIKTNSFCPTVEVILSTNNSKKDSLKIHPYSSVGLKYTNVNQTLINQFVTIDNAAQFVSLEKVKVIEFLVYIGGGIHYNISQIFFLRFCVAAQIGFNNVGNLSTRHLSNQFYQFYILSSLQLGIKLNKRFSIITHTSSSFFITQNDVSVSMPDKFFNYSPAKITVNAGLQFKLFK